MTRLRKVASMFQIVDLMYPTEKESLLDRTLDERHKLLHMRVWIKSRKRINSPLLWTVPRMVTEPLWKEEFLGAALKNGDFFRECRAQAHQSAKVH